MWIIFNYELMQVDGFFKHLKLVNLVHLYTLDIAFNIKCEQGIKCVSILNKH